MPGSPSAFWLVAGPNGAGKTTFIQRATAPGGRLEGMPAPNLDRRTGDLLSAEGFENQEAVPTHVYWRCFKQADEELQALAVEKIRLHQAVCIETVLSTDKYQALVNFAHEHSVPFYLIYVALRSSELACERVAQRVSMGGHRVPEHKIVERYNRSLDNLPVFAAKADEFFVFDNSDSSEEGDPLLVAQGKNGKLLEMDEETIPAVAERLLLPPLG